MELIINWGCNLSKFNACCSGTLQVLLCRSEASTLPFYPLVLGYNAAFAVLQPTHKAPAVLEQRAFLHCELSFLCQRKTVLKPRAHSEQNETSRNRVLKFKLASNSRRRIFFSPCFYQHLSCVKRDVCLLAAEAEGASCCVAVSHSFAFCDNLVLKRRVLSLNQGHVENDPFFFVGLPFVI